MNPACARIEPELSAFLDGELDPHERARVESHVASCPRCEAELQALARVGQTLRRWDAQECRSAPSTGFRNRVLSSLGIDGMPAPEIRAWRRGAWAAAAAAGIVASFAWAAGRRSVPGPDEFDVLRARVETAERQVAEALAARPGAPAATARPVEPLGEVPPIVGPATARVREIADAAPEDAWELRSEGMLLRDAVADFERFESDRRRLAIEGAIQQRLARVEANRGSGAGGQPTSAAAPASPIAMFLAQATVDPVRLPDFERVQVWPIRMPTVSRDVRTLAADAALDERVLRVNEDSRGNVVAENHDLKGRRVLLIAGDVIRGGRRDRVVRESVLLEPGRGLTLPVVGASTERRSGRPFSRSHLVAPFDLRSLLAATQFGQRVEQAEFDEAVQSALVDLASFGSDGNVASLENLWTNGELQGEVRRYTDAFRIRLDAPDVAGFAVSVGPEIVGAEICGDTETFRGLGQRLLRSHILTALIRRGDVAAGDGPAPAEISALLTAAAQAVFDEPVPSGDGRIGVFRSVDGRTYGTGILDSTRVLHATVYFGTPGGTSPATSGAGRRGVGRDTGAAGATHRTPEGGPDRPAGGSSGGGLDNR